MRSTSTPQTVTAGTVSRPVAGVARSSLAQDAGFSCDGEHAGSGSGVVGDRRIVVARGLSLHPSSARIAARARYPLRLPAGLSRPLRDHPSLHGTSKPGGQQIAITASHIELAPPVPLTQASVQVSFDGGKTWHSAIVSELSPGHFRAKFTAPAGAKVTLRTRVSGTAATSVTETIWDAYRVANGGHG
jgi:hypothetical protein